MNRLDQLFSTKKNNILSIYFTAGYPKLNSVEEIVLLLEKNGADMIEIGMPYSDPLADGPVIQKTSTVALQNGMSIKNLFDQLKGIREKTSIPLLLMGYINPVLQFGFSNFCKSAANVGIDGLIIPDLPAHEFDKDFRYITEDNNLKNIFLITPDTSTERIRQTDNLASGFIYMVSSASITGKTGEFSEAQLCYFKRIQSMKLKNPVMAGFGIHDRKTIEDAFSYVNGAIIGSAYMRALLSGTSIEDATEKFFKSLINR
jgi:tryptophan synthase alpha chain